MKYTRFYFVVFSALFFFSCSYASYGKLFLKNGKSIEGNIDRQKDGSYLVSNSYATVKFEQREIKTIKYNESSLRPENKIVSIKPAPKADKTPERAKFQGYEDIICSAADKEGMDPQLLKAVMKAESNFNRLEISNKGACGLMQLMPHTAKLLGVKNIFSPSENVHAGARFLKQMLYEFDGDLELALAAYNAGPGNVKKYNKTVPPFKETRNYIKTVYKHYNSYYKPNRIYTYTDDKGCLNIYNVK